MPRGGHNAKPTKLKVIEGTFRSHRAPKNEVAPQPIIPKPPASIDRYARHAWHRLSPILKRLGLLTEADAEMFFALCEAWGRWERARRRLTLVLRSMNVEESASPGPPSPSADVLRVKQKLEGDKVVSEERVRTRDFALGRRTLGKQIHGVRKDHPAVMSLEQLTLIRTAEISVERAEFSFRQLSAEFGLTPAARSRLDVYAPPPENEEDDFARKYLSGPSA